MMSKIQQTLAEQMQVTDIEIQKRKSLLDFNAEDVAILAKHKTFITKYIDDIVKDFYDKQIQVSEISLLIGDSETLRRLKSAMRRYILELFDGHYDADYVNKRLRIGKVHQRIGVSPKLYIAAIHLLQQVLNSAIEQHGLDNAGSTDEHQLKCALNKLLMFDIQFVFDTYIASLVSEVDTTKQELQVYAATLEETIAERTQELANISRTDELTNLFNQRAFYEHLRHDLSMAERYQEPLSLCYFDLNCFKAINDCDGHMAGDDILSTVGKAMREAIRDTDIGCRYGGDEFCIILPRTAVNEAERVVNRLIECFQKHAGNSEVSFSVGIIDTGPEEFMDADTLLRKADKLMYLSKAQAHQKPGFYISSSINTDPNVVEINFPEEEKVARKTLSSI